MGRTGGGEHVRGLLTGGVRTSAAVLARECRRSRASFFLAGSVVLLTAPVSLPLSCITCDSFI